MPTSFATGLTGGAAANNINVLSWDLGRAIARSTDRKVSASQLARTLISRRSLVEYVAQQPYTNKTS